MRLGLRSFSTNFAGLCRTLHFAEPCRNLQNSAKLLQNCTCTLDRFGWKIGAEASQTQAHPLFQANFTKVLQSPAHAELIRLEP